VNAVDIRRIVVLGHDGFIGSHIVQALTERSGRFQPEILGKSVRELDLTQRDEGATLAPLCDETTAFVICAGVKRQLGDTLDAFEQNVQMATNLARVFADRPPRRVIFFSSAAVYGEQHAHPALSEETPLRPTSLYGIAKLTSELVLTQATERWRDRCAIAMLRPPLVYGPGDRSHGYGPAGFVRSAVCGEPIELWGDGTELRGFTYVGDVAALVARLIDVDVSGPLNVNAGASASFRDVLDALSTVTTLPEVRSRDRSRPAVDHCYVDGRLQALFPSFAFTPLQRGVALTFDAAVQTHVGERR